MFKSLFIDYIENCLISLYFCRGEGESNNLTKNLLIWKRNFFLYCDVIKKVG